MLNGNSKIFAIIFMISLLGSSCSNTATKANIKLECPSIEADTSDLKSNGTLILQGAGKTYSMNMVSMSLTQINRPNEALLEFSVSPNQRQIAYYKSEFNQPDANLIVAGVNNEIYKTLPWESEEWGAFKWLDNERLIIELIPPKENNSPISYTSDFLVLSPFTGEKQILKTNYPDVYDAFPMPNWNGQGITAYNETLTRVVYLEGDVSGPFYYVLWDIPHKSRITNFQIIGDLDAVPRWSSDGEQFAFAPSLFSKMKQYPAYELYDVTKDGDTRQLTHLADYYPSVYVADLSWSPDNSHIAFWFSHWKESESPSYGSSVGDRYLAIVDTKTEVVTNYCINGEKHATIGLRIYPAPVWSPDSQQVVIQRQTSTDSFQTILIDLQENRAYKIGNDLAPVGWMASP